MGEPISQLLQVLLSTCTGSLPWRTIPEQQQPLPRGPKKYVPLQGRPKAKDWQRQGCQALWAHLANAPQLRESRLSCTSPAHPLPHFLPNLSCSPPSCTIFSHSMGIP